MKKHACSTSGKILAEANEVLRENPSQCHFVHHKSYMDRPEIEPGRSQ